MQSSPQKFIRLALILVLLAAFVYVVATNKNMQLMLGAMLVPIVGAFLGLLYVMFHSPLSTIVSLAILGLMILSVWQANGLRRERLVSKRTIADMLTLSPTDFENMVGEMFKTQGYKVEHRGGPGDQGVDLILVDGKGHKRIVQCKRYSPQRRVTRAVIAELDSVIGNEGALDGILVTTGYVTRDTLRWAKEKDIEMISGEALSRMMSETFPEQGRVSNK